MWAEYQLTAAIFDIPVSKLFGTGHNGFSTGETDEDYYISSLEALQSTDIEDILFAHYDRLMMSEYGKEMEMDIVFNPLKVMSAKELAEVNAIKAETYSKLQMAGAISDVDIREALIADKESGFSGMKMLELEEDDSNEEDLDVENINEEELEDADKAPQV